MKKVPTVQVDDPGTSRITSDHPSAEEFVSSYTELDRDRIIEFNDERDATSDESSQINSRSAPDDIQTVYSMFPNLEITPDRRSALSYVTKDAKERLAKLTGWICPITNESAEMNLQRVIEVAHVVRKSLSGKQLVKLEFILGCKYKGLHINTTKNLIHMRVDLHRAYDGAAFMLVPDVDSLEKIMDHLMDIKKNIGEDPEYYGNVLNLKSYKQILKKPEYVYKLVPLYWSLLPKCPQIAVQGAEPGMFESLFKEDPRSEYKYDLLPEFKSHINPFFAVADCAAKFLPLVGRLPPDAMNHPTLTALRKVLQVWETIKTPNAWSQKNLYAKRKPPRNREDPNHPGDPNTPTRPRTTRSNSRHPGKGGHCDNDDNQATYEGKGRSSAYQTKHSYTMAVEFESLSDRDSTATSESSDTGPHTEEVPRNFAPVDNSEYVNNWCYLDQNMRHPVSNIPLYTYV